MTEVRPCDVLSGGKISPEVILVVETSQKSIQAGFILKEQDIEIVTIPGTYFTDNLGVLIKTEVWEPVRAATALARSLFEQNSKMYQKYVEIWNDTLISAINSNSPYLIYDENDH